MDAAIAFEPGGQPRPLGVASVAGVFCLLGMGVVLGTIILTGEHLFYKYTLPRLRRRPDDSIWRSRNVMFFSQKLYRFINCVELVSPHHAARELVHTVRQGQIASLFQKSVKRVRVLDFLNGPEVRERNLGSSILEVNTEKLRDICFFKFVFAWKFMFANLWPICLL